MAFMHEIERRFLIRPSVAFPFIAAKKTKGSRIQQGYLANNPERLIRIRTMGAKKAFLTIKAKALPDGSTPEFEYPIPPDEALAMMPLCRTSLVKDRHEIKHAGNLWEVDVFAGVLGGLVIAEVELPSFDHPIKLLPVEMIEITQLKGYSNAALAGAISDAAEFATLREGLTKLLGQDILALLPEAKCA